MKFGLCSCYLHRSIFLRQVNTHINYSSHEALLKEIEQIVSNQKGFTCTCDELVAEAYAEMDRRKREIAMGVQEKENISKNYIYKFPQEFQTFQTLWLAQKFLQLHNQLPNTQELEAHYSVDGLEGVFHFPTFSSSFVDLLNKEIDNFQASPLAHSQPNTMNRYGILLNELDLIDKVICELREKWLQPLAVSLFPEWVGESGLDSHRAFTVEYAIGEDENLHKHFDGAEVTMNVCLRADCEGSELLFYGMHENTARTTAKGRFNRLGSSESHPVKVHHKPCWGVFHRSQHVHAAAPVRNGCRRNLIIWLRSSALRRERCPRCNEKPREILPAPEGSFGDGFSCDI